MERARHTLRTASTVRFRYCAATAAEAGFVIAREGPVVPSSRLLIIVPFPAPRQPLPVPADFPADQPSANSRHWKAVRNEVYGIVPPVTRGTVRRDRGRVPDAACLAGMKLMIALSPHPALTAT